MTKISKQIAICDSKIDTISITLPTSIIIEKVNSEIDALNSLKYETGCKELRPHDGNIYPNQINFIWSSVREKSCLYKRVIEHSYVPTNVQKNEEHATYDFEEKTT